MSVRLSVTLVQSTNVCLKYFNVVVY